MTETDGLTELPRIISVDDHVLEPPDLWSTRLPAKYRDRGPRIERAKGRFHFEGGSLSFEKGIDDGIWGDWWLYDDLVSPVARLAVGCRFRSDLTNSPITFDEIPDGCWKSGARLADMDANYVDASLCFPNLLPRFCGQTFAEREDKELALLCVRAYNDWMIEEWCGGAARGRLIPLTIVPLWDATLAAAEVRRCADLGSYAVTFSENPFHLGMPSVHSKDRYWDIFFRACEETKTVINMHIGSSSKMPATSPDAPFAVSSVLTFQNAMGSLVDFLLSGVFERFPDLVVAYSEGQLGWMPYVLERADKLWVERPNDPSFGIDLPRPPSTYMPGHVYACIFDDEVGLANRQIIGMDQILFETDYPHSDSTFPHSKDVAITICDKAGLSEAERYKLMRGNAIAAYGLQRFGISQ
jgi:predicted TIM-barrel fold metal-dependent hydrolase